MNRAMELKNDLATLELSREQVESLHFDLDCWAVHDMLFRLDREIKDVRREILVLDAEALVRVAGNAGSIK